MAIQLILLRHGIAENVGENGDDDQRKLTKEGIDKLKRRLPHIKPLVDYPKATYIWSSPLIRARETAFILGDIVGVNDVIYLESIGRGVFQDFSNMLKEVSDETTIFVVGHEPYLSQWAWALAKCKIPFKKGGAASFKVAYQDPSQVTFLWTLDPKEMMKLD